MQNNHMLSDASMQRYPRIRDTGYLQCRDNSSKMLTSSGQPERCTRIKPELTPSLELEAICSLFPRVTLHATDHDGAARYRVMCRYGQNSKYSVPHYPRLPHYPRQRKMHKKGVISSVD